MSSNDNILSGLIRVGTVTNVNSSLRQVRVKYKDAGITSNWLPVLQHNGASVFVSKSDDHTHSGTVGYWMPNINDTVLVIYLPVFNADGFVIGGI